MSRLTFGGFRKVSAVSVGVGIGVAVAIGFCRPTQPIAIATAIPIPIPTEIAFSSLSDTAKCQPTYELISNLFAGSK
jgi:hypothetical protein